LKTALIQKQLHASWSSRAEHQDCIK